MSEYTDYRYTVAIQDNYANVLFKKKGKYDRTDLWTRNPEKAKRFVSESGAIKLKNKMSAPEGYIIYTTII